MKNLIKIILFIFAGILLLGLFGGLFGIVLGAVGKIISGLLVLFMAFIVIYGVFCFLKWMFKLVDGKDEKRAYCNYGTKGAIWEDIEKELSDIKTKRNKY